MGFKQSGSYLKLCNYRLGKDRDIDEKVEVHFPTLQHPMELKVDQAPKVAETSTIFGA